MTTRPSGHQVPTSGNNADSETNRGTAAPSAPAPTHAERCRTLVAASSRGSLATLAVDPAGYPYGSVVGYGLDARGNPILFVSLLAEHTQNALADSRASLLVTEPVPDGTDPLARGRVTLLGRMLPIPDDERAEARERYLAAYPTASYYIDFADFAFYRLDVEQIRYVGGYGRMSWVVADDYATAEPDPLAADADGIIEHMNADHADAQVLFCRHLLGLTDTTGAAMTAVDRYGFEMIAAGPGGREAVRIGFPASCSTPIDVRQAMVAMVAEARAAERAS